MPHERQYPWDILAIDETDDKKTIKKAYAVLIKQYKPDEHPEKFQEIQEAYQYALNILKWDTHDNSDYDNNSRSENNNFTLNENHTNGKDLVTNEESSIIDKVLEKTEQLLQSPLIERENINNWKFLDKSNQILNIKTRELFSQQLFSLFAKYNIKFYKSNKKCIVTTRIIKHINEFVSWDLKWQDYSYLFDKDSMQVMYMNLESDDEIDSIQQVDLTYRLRVLFSDMVMSYAIAGISSYFTGVTYQETLKLAFYIFVIQRFILEMFFNKSMGKFSKNAFISDDYGNKCSVLKTLIRHLIINLTLLPIYFWIYKWNINSNLWISAFCVMVFLHLMSLFNKDKFFHDVITKTTVLRKTGSFEY